MTNLSKTFCYKMFCSTTFCTDVLNTIISYLHPKDIQSFLSINHETWSKRTKMIFRVPYFCQKKDLNLPKYLITKEFEEWCSDTVFFTEENYLERFSFRISEMNPLFSCKIQPIPRPSPGICIGLKDEEFVKTGVCKKIPERIKKVFITTFFKGDIPETVEHLDAFLARRGSSFKIPKNLVSLKISDSFFQNISFTRLKKLDVNFIPQENHLFPNTLTHLTVRYFDKPTGKIPDTITHLSVYCFRDRIFQAKIPSSVKSLKLQGCFNQSIKIPEGVETLVFGDGFCKSIEGILPSTLKTLVLGNDFCEQISGFLPEGLESLSLGYHFEGNLEHLPNLTYLKFFEPCAKYDLPQSIKVLEILSRRYFPVPFRWESIPPSVVYLSLDPLLIPRKEAEKIPETVKILDLKRCWNSTERQMHFWGSEKQKFLDTFFEK